jgi:hypothetical protein
MTDLPSAFAHQMNEAANRETDPVRAMTMRVASEMMAIFPRHASNGKDIETLIQSLPGICISLIETVCATGYKGDMTKTRIATEKILDACVDAYAGHASRIEGRPVQ